MRGTKIINLQLLPLEMSEGTQGTALKPLPWLEAPPSLPGVRCRYRSFPVNFCDIASTCEYELPSSRTDGGAYRWPFREFRSSRRPTKNVGHPGDIWLQTNGKNIIFARLWSEWVAWPGFRHHKDQCTAHPLLKRRYLACSDKKFSWVTFKHIEVLNRVGQPLVSSEIVASVLEEIKRRKYGYKRHNSSEIAGKRVNREEADRLINSSEVRLSDSCPAFPSHIVVF